MSARYSRSAEETPLPPLGSDEAPSRHWSEEVLDHQSKTMRKFKPFNANDAPHFSGLHVTEFIEAFEDYCYDRAIPLSECITRIPRQCTTPELKETIMDMPAYLSATWANFRSALLKEFEDTDPHQFRQTEDYLRSLRASDENTADKLEGFCNRWVAAERVIVQKGQRNTAELTLILFDCLSPSLLKRIVVGTDLDRSKAETLQSSIVITNLRKEVAKKRAFERVTRDAPRERRRAALLGQDDLAIDDRAPFRTDNEGYARKPQVNFAEAKTDMDHPKPRSRSNSNQSLLPPALRQPSVSSRTQAPARTAPTDIDELTKRFATFSMNFGAVDQALRDLPGQLKSVMSASVVPSVTTAPAPSANFAPQQHSQPPRYPQAQYAPPTNRYPNSTNPVNGGYQTGPGGAPRPFECNYCGGKDHIKRSCNILYSDVQDGYCHEQGNFVHEGPAAAGGPALDPRGLAGRPLRDRLNIPAAPAPAQDPTPSVKVSTIGVIHPDRRAYYGTDTDEDDTELDEVTVHAARVAKRTVDEPWKDDARETLKKRSAREAKLPNTRNKLSREGWKPVLALAEEAMQLDESGARLDELPAGVPATEVATERKPRARAGQTWLQTQLADQDPEAYLRSILKKAKLEVTVWDLLSSSPTLQSLMFRKLMVPLENAKVATATRHLAEVRVNSIGFLQGVLHYLEDTPKIRVRIGEAIRSVLGLIDTGAEVNVMTSGLAHEARLFVRPEPSLSMVSHTGHTKRFTGVCDNVDIDVGGVVLKGNFFVLDEAEHSLVLGNPFIKYAQLTFRYDGTGRQFASVAGAKDGEVEILASDARTEKDLAYEKSLVRGKAMLA